MGIKYDFSGIKVVVTGGDTGIGLSIAKSFMGAGANVAICARNREKLANVKRETGVLTYECDIRSNESVNLVVHEIMGSLGGIDILINNAGITCFGELHRLSVFNWNNSIQTNLNGTFYFSQAASKEMIKRSEGRIINISSIKANFPEFAFIGYSVSKAGVSSLTRGMAMELARYNITVNAILPGYVDSGHIPQEYHEKLSNEVPQKRILETKEISNLALFLSSNESRGITGQTIEVAGGLGLGKMGDESNGT